MTDGEKVSPDAEKMDVDPVASNNNNTTYAKKAKVVKF